MKKFFRSLLCIVLVAAMTATTAIQAFAASTTEYVSEIKMAICDSLEDAKAELSGYKVLESDLNDGQGNGAQSVYLGYKTTTDKSKAITDLRLMDMNGGYSFCDYEKALQEQLEAAQEEINSFSDAITEFRQNYNNGSKNAIYAHDEMNTYKDDDQNVLIGNLFVSDDINMKKLQTVFMQGNSSVILSIEELLAIGCADNWLGRLVKNGTKVYGADAYVLEKYCEPIRAQWGDLYSGLMDYQNQLDSENGYDLSEYTDESYEEWINGEGVTDSMINIVLTYGPAYIILDDIDFKGGTLLDYFMVPLDEVDYEYLYPMAEAMTKGQIQTMKYIGLPKALCYANVDISVYSEDLKNNEQKIKEMAAEEVNKDIEDESQKITVSEAGTVISVYSGVDRSLFEQDGGLALTNDLIRQSSSSDDASAISQILNNVKTQLIVTAVVGTVAIVASAVGLYITRPVAIETVAQSGMFSVVLEGEASKSFIASGVGLGIAIGVTLIVSGIFLYQGYQKYMNPDYKTVPRAIVDQKTVKLYDSYGNEAGEKKYYLAYYAVEDATPDGVHGSYADMNGWKAQQWNVMYYTRDSRAGEPILADTFVVQYGNSTKPDGYTPFCEFGVAAAADVNKHAFKEVQGIYLFYKTAGATSTPAGLASVFSNGYYALAALAGLVAGAGVMLGVGAIINKKKRKENITAEA